MGAWGTGQDLRLIATAPHEITSLSCNNMMALAQRAQGMKLLALALSALIVAGAPMLAAAQALTKCTVGEPVTDQEDKTGVVISAGSNLCQVKYPDGQVYGWIYWNLRPATAAAQPGLLSVDPKPPVPPVHPVSPDTQSTTILRAAPSPHTLVYRADPRGHVTITATVNGAPVRFLVDTGASRVTLTAEDARTAGIGGSELVFNQRSRTANGLAREAPVTLREIRIEQLSIDNVAAAVNENLNISLLGMSFLKRLKSFEMREGALTINW
jgi:clan AA aspartic protease (TIGR02281 family)